jgi:hypothetical protein
MLSIFMLEIGTIQWVVFVKKLKINQVNSPVSAGKYTQARLFGVRINVFGTTNHLIHTKRPVFTT